MLKHLSHIDHIRHTETDHFFLIAGPCVVENEKNAMYIAEKVKNICEKLSIPYIFKASYRKANRSKLNSFMGIGDEKALKTIRKVKETYQVPVLTDFHSIEEAIIAAEYVDVLQIPAFLCRQTDMLLAAGKTGKFINIKKGQFLAPDSMKFVVNKIESTGNKNIMITDRGTMFGYQDLIVDYRSIPEMQKTGKPVVLDVTHSLQQPNQQTGVSGGKPELIETIAKAGMAVGADGIFIETHPDPANALSDGSNMLQLGLLENLLNKLLKIRKAIV